MLGNYAAITLVHLKLYLSILTVIDAILSINILLALIEVLTLLS